jgi:uncharacterized protein (UPF0548 family)
MPLSEEACRIHREQERASSWLLTYGTVPQQVATLMVEREVVVDTE